jgi:xanthine dehydrogenase small subunit
MPLLIALRAHVVLMSARGHREMPLEDFYAGYRKNVLAADEVLAWIKVPRPHPGEREPAAPERERQAPSPSGGEREREAPSPSGGEREREAPSPSGGGLGWGREFLRAYKISKRYDDDISAVCLVLNMTVEDNTIAKVSIGAGGVAPTPARAARTESFLLGKEWSQATALHAAKELRAEFQPIGDMRASASYRSEVLGNLVQRFWLESQGVRQINLESWTDMPDCDPASIAARPGDPWIADQIRNGDAGAA